MTTITTTETTIACPDCGAQTPLDATTCAACGARTFGSGRLAVRWDARRRRLRVSHGAPLPMGRCLVCGGSSALERRTVTASWNDDGAADAGACLGLVGGRLVKEVYLHAVARTFSLDLPVCAGCRRREQLVRVLGAVLGFVAAVGLPLLGLVIGARLTGLDGGGLLPGLVGGAVAFLAAFAAWTVSVARRTRIERVDCDDLALTVRLPSRVAGELLAEYEAERAR